MAGMHTVRAAVAAVGAGQVLLSRSQQRTCCEHVPVGMAAGLR